MAKRITRDTVPARERRSPIGADKEILRQRLSDLVKFNYKYLHLCSEKFCFSDCTTEYFYKLLERLQGVCQMTARELRSPYGNAKSLRSHSIDWNLCTEKCFGIPDEEEIVGEPWQFSVSGNEHGRVHGFFIDEVFYVVWLDPDHRLYSA